jgi:hypothetical protein
MGIPGSNNGNLCHCLLRTFDHSLEISRRRDYSNQNAALPSDLIPLYVERLQRVPVLEVVDYRGL